MGWKGYVRSSIAASNRAARESERKRKQREKALQLSIAAQKVRESESFIRSLVSIHKKCSRKVDWNEVINISEPLEPKRLNVLEDNARFRYNNFKANFFYKLFRIENWRKKSLEKNISKAINKDDYLHAVNFKKYKNDQREWLKNHSLAKRILSREISAYNEVIQNSDPLKFYHDISLSFENEVLNAKIRVRDKNIIPNEKYFLRQSGTLSSKQISKKEASDLYQNYVCSCLIRVANEIFSLLPVDTAIVDAIDDILNQSTGYKEEQVILSVFFVKETISSLNMEALNPSSAIENFVHNMAFKREVGFEAVKSLIYKKISD